MNIYEVLFPNDFTFIVSAKEDLPAFINRFSAAKGMQSSSGAVYNPKQYILVRPIPDYEANEFRRVQILSKVLIE